MTDVIQVVTTTSSREEADKIAQALVHDPAFLFLARASGNA